MKFELPTTFEDDDEDEDVFYDTHIVVEEAVARKHYGTEMRAEAVVCGREETPEEKPKQSGSKTTASVLVSSTLQPNHTNTNHKSNNRIWPGNNTAGDRNENEDEDDDDGIVFVGVRPAPSSTSTVFQQPPPPSSSILQKSSALFPRVTDNDANDVFDTTGVKSATTPGTTTTPSSFLPSAPQQLLQQLKLIFVKVTTQAAVASRSAVVAAAGINSIPSDHCTENDHQHQQQQYRRGVVEEEQEEDPAVTVEDYCGADEEEETPSTGRCRRRSSNDIRAASSFPTNQKQAKLTSFARVTAPAATQRPHDFTAEEIERIQQILHADHADHNDEDIVLSHQTSMIRRASMHSLRPKVWLQDEPVNYYLQVVLTQRDRQLCDNDPTRKRSHFFNSFFVTELLKQYDNHNNNGNNNSNPNNNNNTKNKTCVVVDIDDPDVVRMDVDGGGINDTGTTGKSFRNSINRGSTSSSNNTYHYDYKSVARWSKKVPLKDIFDLDKLFFPINVSNVHWILGIIDLTKKQILILDSLVENEEAAAAAEYRTDSTVMADRYAYALFQYVLDEYRDKKQVHLPEAQEWKILTSSSLSASATNKTTTTSTTRNTIPTPQQRNDYDCGVFLCYFATCVSIDVPISSVDQGYITEYYGRERIVLSILNGTVVL